MIIVCCMLVIGMLLWSLIRRDQIMQGSIESSACFAGRKGWRKEGQKGQWELLFEPRCRNRQNQELEVKIIWIFKGLKFVPAQFRPLCIVDCEYVCPLYFWKLSPSNEAGTTCLHSVVPSFQQSSMVHVRRRSFDSATDLSPMHTESCHHITSTILKPFMALWYFIFRDSHVNQLILVFNTRHTIILVHSWVFACFFCLQDQASWTAFPSPGEAVWREEAKVNLQCVGQPWGWLLVVLLIVFENCDPMCSI